MHEVMPTEPLHDIKEHISNVVTEIVAHLPDKHAEDIMYKSSLVDSGRNERPTLWLRLLRDVYRACQTAKR